MSTSLRRESPNRVFGPYGMGGDAGDPHPPAAELEHTADGEIDERPQVIPGPSTSHRRERSRGGVETESPC
jgi:hypothetical protein